MLRIIAVILLIISVNVQADDKKQLKIIALAPHIVEMLYAIGAGDQIIATLDHADYPQAAKKIPSIGNYARVQIERVVELQPDLVFAWRTGTPADDMKRIEQLGFNVIYSQPKQLIEIAAELLAFGKATGHEAQAKQVAQQFTEQLAQIRLKYAGKPKISVFYELWHEPLSTVAKDSWPQLHLDVCRAENQFYGALSPYPQISIEQVVNKNPQAIIQPLSKHQPEKKGFNWHKWKIIKGVKNNQFIHPNADMLHRMTPRVLTELDKLCQQIDQVRQYYKQKG